MLALKIGNQELDLDKETKINFKFTNPIFSENFINEAYSYSTTIPASFKNEKLLKSNKLIQIYCNRTLFVSGLIKNFVKSSEKYSVNIITDTKAINNFLKETYLNQLDLDTFQVWEEEDTALNKVTKWKLFMNDTANLSSTSDARKSMCFPLLKSKGYTNFNEKIEINPDIPFQNQVGQLRNEFHELDGRYINRHFRNNYELGIPMSYLNTYLHPTTVAPCPYVNYLFKKIIDLLNISIDVNELEEIEEFQQMWLFNNQVLDLVEEYEDVDLEQLKLNVFGKEIDLKKHVPNADLMSIFKLMNEVFDVYFYHEGAKMNILLSKNVLNKPAKNYSKYASENFLDEKNNKASFVFSYTDEEIKASDALNVNKTDFNLDVFDLMHKDLSYPTVLNESEKTELSAIPLPSYAELRTKGRLDSYSQFVLEALNPGTSENYLSTGVGTFETWCFSPYYIKSDLYKNDAEIFDKIYFGLFKGFKMGYQKYINNEFGVVPESFPNAITTYNFKQAIISDPSECQNYIDVLPILGESSIYIQGPDNAFDKYKKPKLDILYNAIPKTKLLYLPSFEILEIIKWKNPKHVIQQKKESFSGYIKTIKFALTNQGVSPSEIEYLVPNTLDGEFSSDFNEDYNT
jgi:hypothetical protein